jgi:hypothetical protein
MPWRTPDVSFIAPEPPVAEQVRLGRAQRLLDIYEAHVGHPARSFDDLEAFFESNPQLLPRRPDGPPS